MIVNGIVDPRAQCPGGDPEWFGVGPEFGGLYSCDGDGCIVEPLWDLHLGATEMWCSNTQEVGGELVLVESEHIPIAVPESTLLEALPFMVVTVVALVLFAKYGS